MLSVFVIMCYPFKVVASKYTEYIVLGNINIYLHNILFPWHTHTPSSVASLELFPYPCGASVNARKCKSIIGALIAVGFHHLCIKDNVLTI